MFKKHNKIEFILLIIFLALITGCSSKESSEESSTSEAKYRKITPEEAKEMMVEGNIILDVRTQEEYNAGYIEDATLLPIDDVLADDLDLLQDTDQVILVYCRSGNRSEVASKYLVEKGYTQVYDFGGIIDWPYEVVND
jgi:rhodanese-related sulfurtransferase